MCDQTDYEGGQKIVAILRCGYSDPFYYPYTISLHFTPLHSTSLVTLFIHNLWITLCIMGGMEAIILALIAFIYFYALRWDDIPTDRRRVVYLIPILVIVLAILWGVMKYLGYGHILI